MSPRAIPLACLLFLTGGAASAQSEPPPLSFLGFEAGASLAAVHQQVRALGGRSLRCESALRDRAVRECRATVFDPVSGRAVAVWLSAIDSATGVLTLSGPVSGEELDGWRTELETSFGAVGARVEGPQWMMQWVRRGRMIRLTWRNQSGTRTASVSLIDGRVLDAWGRSRAAAPPPVIEPPGAPAAAADSAGAAAESVSPR